MMLRLSCTFTRCHCVGWEKEQNGGGLLEEAVQGQGVLRFCQSCPNRGVIARCVTESNSLLN